MKLIKTFVKYATGSMFALLAGLITTPILTRLISTEEMGKYSMFITFGSLFASILYLGLDQSYVRFYNDDVAMILYGTLVVGVRPPVLPLIGAVALAGLMGLKTGYRWE